MAASANSRFTVTPILGVRNPGTTVSSADFASNGRGGVPEHALGTRVIGKNGKIYVYAYLGQAAASVSVNVALNAAFTASVSAGGWWLITETTAGVGDYVWLESSAAVG